MSSVDARPVAGSTQTANGDAADYVFAANATRVASDPADGLMLHWAGSIPEGFLTFSAWRDRTYAEQYVTGPLFRALTDLAAANPAARPDITYSTDDLIGFVSGSDAERAAGRQLGEAGDAVAFVSTTHDGAAADYLKAAETIDLFDHPPAGLVAHAATAADNRLRTFDAWLDAESALKHYSAAAQRLAGAAGDGDGFEVLQIPLHTIVVVPGELSQLRVFRA